MDKSLRKSDYLSVLISLTPVLFISLGIIFWKGISEVDFGDGQDYLKSAKSILDNSGYLREGLTWPFFRPPGYPFFIATVWKVSGTESILLLKLFNVAFHLISTYLVFRIVTRNHRRNTGIIGALLFGLNPFVLIPLTEIQTEPLTLLLFLLFSYLISGKYNKFSVILIPFASIFIVAVRPEYLIIILSICLVMLFKSHRNSKVITQVSVIVLILVTSISWWGNQNRQASGSFIPLTNATSYLLWNGSTEYIYRNYEISLQYDPKFDSTQYIGIQNEIKSKIDIWGSQYSQGGLGGQSNLWMSAYFANIQEDPSKYVIKTFEKAAIFWRPFLNPRSHGFTTSLLSLVILLPLSFGAGVILVKNRRQLKKELFVKAYLAGFVGLTIVHAFQMPDQRYKFPLLIPFASILLAPTLSGWIFHVLKKLTPSLLHRRFE